jgi:signal transduction histidine kinase
MKMLDRVLGENIELKFEPAANLPAVLGDTGMLDQVVMNLAVNARDAMPKGGRLVVTTSRVKVDENHVRRRPEARLGQFACLSVTDTGSGMDEKC